MTIHTAKPIAYKGTEPYLFVSYSHFDDHRVYPLIRYLQDHHIRVWYDEGIEIGSEYPRILEGAILNSAAFLQIISSNTVESAFCRKEVGLSLDIKGERKTMIAYIEETDLKYGLRLELRNIQRIPFHPDLSTVELGERIISSLYRIEPRVFEEHAGDDKLSGGDTGKPAVTEDLLYALPLELLGGDHPNVSERRIRSISRCIYEEAGNAVSIRVLSTICAAKEILIDVEFQDDSFEIDYDLYSRMIGNQLKDQLAADELSVECLPEENGVVRFGIPHQICSAVSLRDVMDTHGFRKWDAYLPLGLGVSRDGMKHILDLSEARNLWIGGRRGSGKTELLRSLLVSLLYKNKPSDLNVAIASTDPSDFEVFDNISHFMTPVISDHIQMGQTIDRLYKEMMHRFQAMADGQIHSFAEYHEQCKQSQMDPVPRLVMVIDGVDDYIGFLSQEQENQLCRIAQMGPTAGIHLIISERNMGKDGFMGLLRANVPMVIALRVESESDSETLIGGKGAEKLRLPGDLLLCNTGNSKARPILIRVSDLSKQEIHAVAGYLKEMCAAK